MIDWRSTVLGVGISAAQRLSILGIKISQLLSHRVVFLEFMPMNLDVLRLLELEKSSALAKPCGSESDVNARSETATWEGICQFGKEQVNIWYEVPADPLSTTLYMSCWSNFVIRGKKVKSTFSTLLKYFSFSSILHGEQKQEQSSGLGAL